MNPVIDQSNKDQADTFQIILLSFLGRGNRLMLCQHFLSRKVLSLFVITVLSHDFKDFDLFLSLGLFSGT